MLNKKRTGILVSLLALVVCLVLWISSPSPRTLEPVDSPTIQNEVNVRPSAMERSSATRDERTRDNSSNEHENEVQQPVEDKIPFSDASCDELARIFELMEQLEQEQFASYGFSLGKYREYDQYSDQELAQKISLNDPYAIEMKAVKLSLELFLFTKEDDETIQVYSSFRELSGSAIASGSHTILFPIANAERAMARIAINSDKAEVAKTHAVEAIAWLKLQERVLPHNVASLDTIKDLLASNFEKNGAELDLLWLEVEAEKRLESLLDEVNNLRAQNGIGPIEPHPLILAFWKEQSKLESRYKFDNDEEVAMIIKSQECGFSDPFAQ